MKAIPATLTPAEPFHEDVLERGYRSCDFCYESCADDIWAKRPWRKVYHCERDDLDVCENCIAIYQEEERADNERKQV